MSLLVNNVINSNSQISYSYFGSQEVFGYLVTLNYTIKVEDIQFDNNDGVLLSGRAAIRSAYKRRNITARIAGDEILNGLVTNVSFAEGSLNGEDTVDITIEERRRLDDYSSKTFAKYIPSPHLLEDFSESYDFTRSGADYSYNRRISIKYSQDAGDQFLTNAKAFLTNYYYANRPNLGYYEDGISENARFNNNYNGTLNQTIDLVNLSVELQEDFDSSFIVDSENVSKKITTSSSVGEKGYLTKVISIELTSLKYHSSKVLGDAIGSTIDSIISDEESQFGKPFAIEKGITKDARKASLSISFSTNPELSQENSISYKCTKNKVGVFFEYDLSVTYKAKGKNSQTRYDSVIALWTSSKDKNEAKVLGLFSEATEIYEKSRSATINKPQGLVTENIKYTTDDSYDSGSLPKGILKFKISVQKQEKVKRNGVILDLSDLKEKVVTSDLNSLGSATVTATTTADPAYGVHHGKNFLNSKTTEMNAALEETDFHGISDTVTSNLVDGTTTRVIEYIIA
jgi:hypothetical protein